MEAKELDICITFYNTDLEMFKNTINSVLNQKNKNFNLILLNDGSTNKKLDTYVKNLISESHDIDIEYHTRENKGTMYGRIELSEYAVSPYIHFMDSDDILFENATEIMIKNIHNNIFKKTNVDIIQFEFEYFKKNISYNIDGKNDSYIGYKENVTENKNDVLDLLMRDIVGLKVLWNKIFKRELIIKTFNEQYKSIDSIKEYFSKHVVFNSEDVFMLYFIFSNANSYLHVENKIMKYNQENDRHKDFYVDKMSHFINNTNFIYALYYLIRFTEEKLSNDIDNYNHMNNIITIWYDIHDKVINRILSMKDEDEFTNKVIEYYNKNYSKYTNFVIKDKKLIPCDENIL